MTVHGTIRKKKSYKLIKLTEIRTKQGRNTRKDVMRTQVRDNWHLDN